MHLGTTTGSVVSVTGDEWVLTAGLETDDGRFLQSRILKTATFDVEKGLLVQIAATAAVIDLHYHLVLRCHSDDPALDPNPGHPPEFSYPERLLVEG
jgi:hypothetical protein